MEVRLCGLGDINPKERVTLQQLFGSFEGELNLAITTLRLNHIAHRPRQARHRRDRGWIARANHRTASIAT